MWPQFCLGWFQPSSHPLVYPDLILSLSAPKWGRDELVFVQSIPMTRLGARAWSAAATTMIHVPLGALHLTLEAYADGLRVSLAGY